MYVGNGQQGGDEEDRPSNGGSGFKVLFWPAFTLLKCP